MQYLGIIRGIPCSGTVYEVKRTVSATITTVMGIID